MRNNKIKIHVCTYIYNSRYYCILRSILNNIHLYICLFSMRLGSHISSRIIKQTETNANTIQLYTQFREKQLELLSMKFWTKLSIIIYSSHRILLQHHAWQILLRQWFIIIFKTTSHERMFMMVIYYQFFKTTSQESWRFHEMIMMGRKMTLIVKEWCDTLRNSLYA